MIILPRRLIPPKRVGAKVERSNEKVLEEERVLQSCRAAGGGWFTLYTVDRRRLGKTTDERVPEEGRY